MKTEAESTSISEAPKKRDRMEYRRKFLSCIFAGADKRGWDFIGMAGGGGKEVYTFCALRTSAGELMVQIVLVREDLSLALTAAQLAKGKLVSGDMTVTAAKNSPGVSLGVGHG